MILKLSEVVAECQETLSLKTMTMEINLTKMNSKIFCFGLIGNFLRYIGDLCWFVFEC